MSASFFVLLDKENVQFPTNKIHYFWLDEQECNYVRTQQKYRKMK